jgi:hypothetical protein
VYLGYMGKGLLRVVGRRVKLFVQLVLQLCIAPAKWYVCSFGAVLWLSESVGLLTCLGPSVWVLFQLYGRAFVTGNAAFKASTCSGLNLYSCLARFGA